MKLNYDEKFALEKKETYLSQDPFSHIVLDNFCDDTFLTQILEHFPGCADVNWVEYNNSLEKKLMYSSIVGLDKSFKIIFDTLNNNKFLKFLENLTGYTNIHADENLTGGGLHQIKKGGKLDIHADFNILYGTQKKRCINMILFLNKDWKEEYGGHLEFWDSEMKSCKKRILPIFNRAIIFNTTETSYHGHPEPLLCPDEWTRKSIALYYYIDNDCNLDSHSTKYMKRPLDPDDKELDIFRVKRSMLKKRRGK